LLGLLGILSPTKIKRNATACINCSSCSAVCPAFIPVDKVNQVRSDECTACLACVDSCPVSNTLTIKTYRSSKPLSRVKWAIALLVFFWGALLIFKTVGPWENSISISQYQQYMPGVENGRYVHP
jgi:polyferredoxin